jgi:glycosyltransferase involved in cell wall biosynthesis
MLRRRGVPRATSAVPNGVDVAAFEPGGGRQEVRDILFVGYFLHPPNVDGLNHFVSSVWPHLRDQGRRLSVTVVGSGLAADLRARVEAAGFHYAGFVDDLAAEFWSHRVFVCPIRFGAGTRIKLLEAAAARCAIVSTTLGAEGLGLRNGRDALLADDPAAFAQAVLQLLDDKELRVRLGDAAHDTVQRQFDWPVLAGRLERVFYDLLEAR